VSGIRDLSEVGALDAALQDELAVLYKHSRICPTSVRTIREIREFVDRNPDVPVYQVDVIRDRSLARQLADDLGIRHESPQAIVLQNGRPFAHGSHHEVTTDRLEAWCRGAQSEVEE
jgi:bacillithiol system protein YtxJ